MARTLLDTASFSGWGVRTLAAGESGYNPMGYHTGCVWPHDNAIIARGLARYGLVRSRCESRPRCAEVAGATVDLLFVGDEHAVGVSELRRDIEVRVVIGG